MYLSPYLSYDGNAEQAFQRYAQLLGGKIELLLRYGEAPDGSCEGMSAADKNKIMHVRLAAKDWVLMGSDATPEYPYQGIKGMSISLNVDSAADAERIIQGLAEGGHITMPLQPTFWAERFGCVTDAYGVSWLINFEKKPA